MPTQIPREFQSVDLSEKIAVRSGKYLEFNRRESLGWTIGFKNFGLRKSQ